MSPGDGPSEDPVLSQYLDLAGTRGAHLKKPVGDVLEKIDSTELARLPIAGAHLRTNGEESDPQDVAAPGPLVAEPAMAPAPPMVAPVPTAVRESVSTSATLEPETVQEPAAASEEASSADLAELIGSALADPPAGHTNADVPVPAVVWPPASSAPQVEEEEGAPDPLDAILEAEFGVYVEMASAPPPVPAFDAWTPPVEPIAELALEPVSDGVVEPRFEAASNGVVAPVFEPLSEPVSNGVVAPVFEPLSEQIHHPELASVSEFFADELPDVAPTRETVSSPASRPLDDEW
jgi:hypothetical protein